VPPELLEEAKRGGGIIGAAQLTGCVAYRTVQAFVKDQARHLNDPSWFEGPLLYGFTFAHAEPLPFRAMPGWMRFFPVEPEDAPTGERGT
jgi:hypothetical protein